MTKSYYIKSMIKKSIMETHIGDKQRAHKINQQSAYNKRSQDRLLAWILKGMIRGRTRTT